jgi:hypothetical protein
VKNKAYQPAGNVEGYPVSVYDEKAFKDVEVTLRFKSVNVEGSKYDIAGLLLRAKTVPGSSIVSGYLVLIVASDAETSVAQIVRFTNLDLATGSAEGSETLCAEEVTGLANKGELTVNVKGNKFKAFYGGDLVCSATDDTYGKGKVGLFSYSVVPEAALQATEVELVTK